MDARRLKIGQTLRVDWVSDAGEHFRFHGRVIGFNVTHVGLKAANDATVIVDVDLCEPLEEEERS